MCSSDLDAAVLAEELPLTGDVAPALARYEERRVARANGIVLGARRFGQVAQWRHPLAVWLRNTAARLSPSRVAARQVQSLWRT